VFLTDRWFPSSKTCVDFEYKMGNLPLSERNWACPACGAGHGRDHNASLNLEQGAKNGSQPKLRYP